MYALSDKMENDRGAALRGLERHDEPLQSYERSLALQPTAVEIPDNIGNAQGGLPPAHLFVEP